MSDKPIEVGTEVRIKPEVRKQRGPKLKDLPDHKTAVVLSLLENIQGGVYLDRHLGGFRYWNVVDLEVVR